MFSHMNDASDNYSQQKEHRGWKRRRRIEIAHERKREREREKI